MHPAKRVENTMDFEIQPESGKLDEIRRKLDDPSYLTRAIRSLARDLSSELYEPDNGAGIIRL